MGAKPNLSDAQLDRKLREIKLTKVLAYFSFAVGVVGTSVRAIYFGATMEDIAAIFAICLNGLAVIFLRLEKLSVAKFLVSMAPIVGGFIHSVTSKLSGLTYEGSYYHYRFALIIFCVLPFTLLSHKKTLFKVATAVAAVLIIFFDPIHELFNVGYYQVGNTFEKYYFVNVYSILSLFLFLFCMVFYKKVIEKYEQSLNERRESLRNKNRKLNEAKIIIDEKNRQLELYNTKLKFVVEQERISLALVNHELIEKYKQATHLILLLTQGVESYHSKLSKILEKIKPKLEDKLFKKLNESITHSFNASLRNVKDSMEKSFFDSLLDRTTISDLMQAVFEEFPALKKNAQLTIKNGENIQIVSLTVVLESILTHLISFSNLKSQEEKNGRLNLEIGVFEQDNSDKLLIEYRDNLRYVEENLTDLISDVNPKGKFVELYLVKIQMESINGEIELNKIEDDKLEIRLTIPHLSNV